MKESRKTCDYLVHAHPSHLAHGDWFISENDQACDWQLM
jgi:hypothetical protein